MGGHFWGIMDHGDDGGMMGVMGPLMGQNEELLDLILNENPIGAAGTTGEGGKGVEGRDRDRRE